VGSLDFLSKIVDEPGQEVDILIPPAQIVQAPARCIRPSERERVRLVGPFQECEETVDRKPGGGERALNKGGSAVFARPFLLDAISTKQASGLHCVPLSLLLLRVPSTDADSLCGHASVHLASSINSLVCAGRLETCVGCRRARVAPHL
jgi:hypothetical protein